MFSLIIWGELRSSGLATDRVQIWDWLNHKCLIDGVILRDLSISVEDFLGAIRVATEFSWMASSKNSSSAFKLLRFYNSSLDFLV